MEQQLDIWLKLGGLLTAAVTALWAYTRFVLERGLLPPSEFSIECSPIGEYCGRRILEVLLRIRNLGSATLIVSNLRVDLRYIDGNAEGMEKTPLLFSEPTKDTFGTVCFPGSLTEDDLHLAGEVLIGKEGDVVRYDKDRYIGINEARRVVVGKERSAYEMKGSPKGAKVLRAKERGGRGIPVLSYDTFVQPGVNQAFTFVTAVPVSVSYVLIHSSFRYGVHPRYAERLVLGIARTLGMIHYSLSHVTQPHTAERVFNVAASSKGAS